MASRKGPRARVLVVEDEAYVRQSLLDVLRARDYEVEPAASVADTLSR